MTKPTWSQVAADLRSAQREMSGLHRAWNGNVEVPPLALDSVFAAAITMADLLARKED